MVAELAQLRGMNQKLEDAAKKVEAAKQQEEKEKGDKKFKEDLLKEIRLNAAESKAAAAAEVGDGATVDTRALRAALRAAGSQGGGTVPSGLRRESEFDSRHQ